MNSHQNHRHSKPNSFADTVQLVESYVTQEIIKEAQHKQLYYHNLYHALAVRRRARQIFQQIAPVLSLAKSQAEIERLAILIDLCSIAHDMVQLLEPNTAVNGSRKRPPRLSEIATADKLLKYVAQLNKELTATADSLDSSVLFSDRDCEIIRDAIEATICIRDPLAGKADYSFSPQSIYQPYLYDSQPKISIVGSILALADLGTLGMEGVEEYIQDGILIFLEDNPNFKDPISNCNLDPSEACNYLGLESKAMESKLLGMTRFMVNLAYERQARFELEISGFDRQVRQILRDRVFVYLTPENIQQVAAKIPTQDNLSLSVLLDFFCLNQPSDRGLPN